MDKTDIAFRVIGIVLMVGIGLLVFIPLTSNIVASLPKQYTGTVTYKSGINSYGIGIGAQNTIYLILNHNQTIDCSLFDMTSIQQAHILSLQVGQNVTISVTNHVCDTS